MKANASGALQGIDGHAVDGVAADGVDADHGSGRLVCSHYRHRVSPPVGYPVPVR